MFHVGQKVVCVDAVSPDSSGRSGEWRPGSEIRDGSIYTIREIGLTNHSNPGLRLLEVRLDAASGGIVSCDLFYRANRFRPVVERKTDISFAHEILREVTRKNRVTA